MQLHLPKPLHGWRKFAHEVIIVAIGALLALLGENFIESRDWRDQREHAEEALKAEVLDAATTARERLATQECFAERIAILAVWVARRKQVPPPLLVERGSSSDALPTLYDVDIR